MEKIEQNNMIGRRDWEGCLRRRDSSHSGEPATGRPGGRGFQAERTASVNEA